MSGTDEMQWSNATLRLNQAIAFVLIRRTLVANKLYMLRLTQENSNKSRFGVVYVPKTSLHWCSNKKR